MKVALKIFFLVFFNLSGFAQSLEYNLKNIDEIYVRAHVPQKDFGIFVDYLTEYEIQRLVETELMNNNITVGDNEDKAKFVFDVTISSYKYNDNIIMNVDFELGEKVLLKRTNDFSYATEYKSSALGVMPNKYNAVDYIKNLIKDQTNNFIYELKKDNQK